jgi:heterodisulfide reductase subunit C
MPGTAWQRKIKYEEELSTSFPADIAAEPGGEKLFSCIQCGTCSGTCPVSPYMDYTPRRIVAMTRAGFKKEVLNSFTIWLCASCYACTAECPKEIKITDIMYALKQRAIAEGRYPRRFPIPVLAREFYNMVLRRGRSNEAQLIVALYWHTNIFAALKQAVMGLKLFLRGRLIPFDEALPSQPGKKGDLKTILNAVGKAER